MCGDAVFGDAVMDKNTNLGLIRFEISIGWKGSEEIKLNLWSCEEEKERKRKRKMMTIEQRKDKDKERKRKKWKKKKKKKMTIEQRKKMRIK